MMDTVHSVCIRFSGITFRFRFPGPVTLAPAFADLACDDPGQVDEEFEIRLLTHPLRPAGTPLHYGAGIHIYPEKEGWLRIYPALIAEDGCQVACLLCPDGKNILYYPAARWDFYAGFFNCFHLIGCETLLLRRSAFLLHSAVVMHSGRMVLFSGPAYAGKSTQADLWVRHLGAQLVNGDRCVVMERDGVFCGGGSPWAGTSGIFRPQQAPIAGIFLIHQAPENSVQRLGAAAFAPLLTQTLVNSWDPPFMQTVTDLLARLLEQVPVYRLNCRPDEEAARLAHRTLFPEEVLP